MAGVRGQRFRTARPSISQSFCGPDQEAGMSMNYHYLPPSTFRHPSLEVTVPKLAFYTFIKASCFCLPSLLKSNAWDIFLQFCIHVACRSVLQDSFFWFSCDPPPSPSPGLSTPPPLERRKARPKRYFLAFKFWNQTGFMHLYIYAHHIARKSKTGPRHPKHGLCAAAGPEHFLCAMISVVNARPKKGIRFWSRLERPSCGAGAEAAPRRCGGRDLESSRARVGPSRTWTLLLLGPQRNWPVLHSQQPRRRGRSRVRARWCLGWVPSRQRWNLSCQGVLQGARSNI